ncbi:MAG: 2-C-methyl-D-erythritol 2,4-cyclodiphosphate synthase [Culicoidibacterales bacterium]
MIRIGQSTDIHQLVEGRRLFLGGVEIPHDKGLLGHSDADVLLHAITEAMIGALGLGDIGAHFPDTDPKYKGIDSKILLAETVALLHQQGYRVGNVDSTILAEQPKLRPHIESMCETIAAILQVERTQVNVKATRGEKMGFVGREEGIMAQAVVLVVKQ